MLKLKTNLSTLSKKRFIVYSIGLVLLSSCSSNKYQKAESFFKAGNYPIAVEEMDKIIKSSKNGYEVTLSENTRSESYFQLAEKARQKNNNNLAIRLYYLANSDKADEKIIECYNELAEDFRKKDDKVKVIMTYNYIINNMYQSPRIPEFMYYRIRDIYTWYNDKPQVWDYYTALYNIYPQSEYLIKSQLVVDEFLKEKIDNIVSAKKQNENLPAIIETLIQVKTYPSSYQDYISKEIALIYIQMAENDIKATDYISADLNFRKCLEFDSTKQEYVDKRLREVCDLFISHGHNLLAKRQIDEAISFYNRAFTIIPDYIVAKNAIARAEKRRSDIQKAEELKQEAIQLDRKKKYTEALEIFKRAYQLDDTKELADLIFETNNIIQIEKDPKSFAMKVVNEYEGGIILKRVAGLKSDLAKKWGKDMRESGWKTIGSATRMKMELRYDFITPDDNYFLAWQVNMKDRAVIPLNKLTEKLTGKQQ